MEKTKSYWVGAKEIMRITGWSSRQMQRQRKNNPDFWKVTKGGGYLYDITKIPESLLIKTA